MTERKTRRDHSGVWARVSPLAVPCCALAISATVGFFGGWAMRPADRAEPVRVEAAPIQVTLVDSRATEYSAQDLELLALTIYQEAGADTCSDATRQMVGEVVLNRVADDRFPGTIFDVVLQRAQYGRLHWTGPVWPDRAELPQEAHAVQRAYDCAAALLSGSVARLLPADVVYQAEFPQGVETVAHQDGLYFCR